MKELELKRIDQKIYIETLGNGLSIYMLPNNKVANYYINFVSKYGSIDTEFKIDDKEYKVSDGIAHFLEHVNFNVDEGVTATDLFKKMGSYINAYTTFDHTSYEVNSATKFKENLNILLDYVQKDYFTEKLIEKEKGIIVEEVRRVKNSISSNLLWESRKALFVNNKMDKLVVGEENDVRGISLEEVKLVHNTFYNPSNMFIVITGNFKVKEAVDIIKKIQEGKEFKKVNVTKIHHKEPLRVENKLVVVKNEMVKIPKAIVSYKLDRELFKDFDDKELLNYFFILLHNNFSFNSILYEELKEKNMISGMYSNSNIYDNIIVLMVEIESERLQEVIEIVKEKIRHLEVDEDTIVRKRRANIASLINMYDNIEYANLNIIRSIITYDRIYDNLYDIYNKANIKDARNIIKRLNFDNESIVILEK